MPTIEPGFPRAAAVVWGALAVTTLVNTTLPLVAPGAAEARDWVLILHAMLGLAASWCIALALARRAAGAAGAGLVFALVEKGAELAGQILIVFTVHRGWRMELASADAPARAALEAKLALFADLWDDLFLVFWVGALLSNLLWLVAARRAEPSRGPSIAFAIMAVLALALILQGYAGQAWIGPALPFAYPILLTASRSYFAWWLWRYTPWSDPSHNVPKSV